VEEGEGPLVLLLHGWPESWYSWRHQISPVADAGFTAVAIDLPGYGRSDKPDVTYDIEWLSACVDGVIAGLGRERAVIAGHDWGGLIAWPFARLYPHRVAGVIGVNTPDIPRRDVPPIQYFKEKAIPQVQYIVDFQERGKPERNIERDIDGFVRLVLRDLTTVNKEAFPDEVLKVYADNFRPRGAIKPTLEYYRNMDRNWELLADVDDTKIEVPCLMISASDDPVLSPNVARHMDDRVPNLTKVIIEECGHWTQQERPEETTRHMLGYLKGMDPW
jgi:pimeloyl-ACP methyl ester carboxylesterase